MFRKGALFFWLSGLMMITCSVSVSATNSGGQPDMQDVEMMDAPMLSESPATSVDNSAFSLETELSEDSGVNLTQIAALKNTSDLLQRNAIDIKGLSVGAVPMAIPTKKGSPSISNGVSKIEMVSIQGHPIHRWYVSRVEGQTIKLDQTQVGDNVYIVNCKNAVIEIPSTVSRIALEHCENVTLRYKSVVAILEIDSCKNMKITRTEFIGPSDLPRPSSIQLDNLDGCTFYMQKCLAEKAGFYHHSSKTVVLYQIDGGKAMRSNFPDSREFEIKTGYSIVAPPKQYLTRLENGKLATENTAHLKSKQGGYVVLPENDFRLRSHMENH